MSYRALALCGVSFANLCWHQDRAVKDRVILELEKFTNMRKEALSLLSVASDEPFFTVWSTEKEIFESVCESLKSRIDTRKKFLKKTPILRLLFPAMSFEVSMGEVLWCYAYHYDGDAYKSYLEFYTRHCPNTVGSVVYQEMMQGLSKLNRW